MRVQNEEKAFCYVIGKTLTYAIVSVLVGLMSSLKAFNYLHSVFYHRVKGNEIKRKHLFDGNRINYFVCVFSKEWRIKLFQLPGNQLFSFNKILDWIRISTWRTWFSPRLFKLKCQRAFLNWHFAAKAASVIDCCSDKSISL